MLTALALVAQIAAPADAAVVLEWPEVVGCPTQAEVVAATQRLIAGGAPQSVRAAGTLERSGAAWTLRLVVDDAGGTQRRVLTSPDCAALGEATAVILAVAAEPLQVAAGMELQPAPDAAVWAVAADPLGEAAAPVMRREQPLPPPGRTRPQLGLFVQGGAGLGPSKGLVPGIVAGLAVQWPRVRVEARGSWWGRSRLRLSQLPDVGADLRLATGGLRGCPLLVRGALVVPLCAGVELGATIVDGVGLMNNYALRQLWAAGSLSVGARWRPRRWVSLGAEVEGLVAFTRREYAVLGVDEPLQRTPPVGLRLLAGVEFNFF